MMYKRPRRLQGPPAIGDIADLTKKMSEEYKQEKKKKSAEFV